jgi:hypothetical protein
MAARFIGHAAAGAELGGEHIADAEYVALRC